MLHTKVKKLEDRKKEEEDENLWKKLKQRVGKPTQVNHHPPPTNMVGGEREKNSTKAENPATLTPTQENERWA